MGRCNCATETCACDERGRYGIAMSGNGTANNPRVHRFDPRVDNILDGSLAWSESVKKLGVRISGAEGNLLQLGTAGLEVFGAEGGGGGNDGSAQVATLPDTNVVCGMFGAGYMHVPENLLRSYERAVALGLDMVLVPVRTLRDGTTVAHTGLYVTRTSDGMATWQVSDMDTQRWAQTPQVASRYYESGTSVQASFDPTTGLHARLDPLTGFFGFSEPPQQSGTFCSEIAARIGRRIVIVWQVFDARAATDLKRIIARYALKASSIVISENLDLLDIYNADGVAVGGVVNNPGQATSNSPENILAVNGTWAFINFAAGLTDEQITEYPQAGLSTMGFAALYQYENERINTPVEDGGLGMRGGVSPDPVYYNGAENGYTYRHQRSTWELGTVEYGQYNDGNWADDILPRRRGGLVWGHNSLFLTEDWASWRMGGATNEWEPIPDAGRETTGPWWIQAGWCSPVQTDDTGSYTIAFWNRWRYVNVNRPSFLAIAFGVEKDHRLRTGPRAGWHRELSQCYVLYLNYYSAGLSYLESWDGTAGGTVVGEFNKLSGSVTNSSLSLNYNDGDLEQNKVEDCWGIQVDGAAGTITIVQATVDRDTGRITDETAIFTYAELVHTGPYVYLGKCESSSTPDTDNQLSVTYRHFDVLPGVLGLREVFEWAA